MEGATLLILPLSPSYRTGEDSGSMTVRSKASELWHRKSDAAGLNRHDESLLLLSKARKRDHWSGLKDAQPLCSSIERAEAREVNRSSG